jgi:hypothetical protein
MYSPPTPSLLRKEGAINLLYINEFPLFATTAERGKIRG